MAQIVTITNPLTGQPAQVDQLEHTAQEIDDAIARALPDGAIDITLQNKAPAGYGLGTTAKLLTADDNLDNIRANGFYGWEDSSPQNAVRSWSAMRVENNSYTGHVVQTCLSWNDNKSYSQLRRIKTDTGWLPWEYINPPMLLGVEYRTTERYKGKPVYIKAVDTGALPNATFKFVAASFPNANAIVDYGGEAYQDVDHFIPLPCLKYGVDSYNNEKGVQVTISNGYGITIATMADFSSFTSSSVWVKYTKSTD